MLQKLLKLFNQNTDFQDEQGLDQSAFETSPIESSSLKLDNGMDTLAAVSRYINLKDSPYVLIRGDEQYEFILQNSENGSIIMRFKSMLKEYTELSQ